MQKKFWRYIGNRKISDDHNQQKEEWKHFKKIKNTGYHSQKANEMDE